MEPLAYYIISLIIILSITTILFFVAQQKKDNSIIDIAYGLTFVIATLVLTTMKLQASALAPASVLILLLITLWGMRLAYRIYSKNKGKPEDFRYQAWRTSWMRKGLRYYYLRACLQIFVLQGLIISIVLLPFTLTLTPTTLPSSLIFFGFILWCIGFYFEVVGDKQLDAFIKRRHEGNKIMQSGLWKYTRHPNYFGESTMWFGLAFIAYSSGVSFLVFLSPILITYLLLKVSGIPMLEKRWAGVPEWEVYKAKTSAFIPLPPGK